MHYFLVALWLSLFSVQSFANPEADFRRLFIEAAHENSISFGNLDEKNCTLFKPKLSMLDIQFDGSADQADVYLPIGTEGCKTTDKGYECTIHTIKTFSTNRLEAKGLTVRKRTILFRENEKTKKEEMVWLNESGVPFDFTKVVKLARHHSVNQTTYCQINDLLTKSPGALRNRADFDEANPASFGKYDTLDKTASVPPTQIGTVPAHQGNGGRF